MKYAIMGLVAAAASLQASQILNLSANDASSLTVSGGQVTAWQNTAGGQYFTSEAGDQPTLVTNATPNGSSALLFNGTSDVLRSIGFGQTANEATVFLVVAPLSNAGNFSGFLSAVDSSTPGHYDYTSGFNIDMTSGASSSFNSLNVESAKGSGQTNLKTNSDPFGTFDVLAITFGDTAGSECLYVDGTEQGCRGDGNGNTLSLQDLRVGARYYTNGGGETGYLNGYISDVEIYNTLLSSSALETESQNLANEYINPMAPSSGVPEPSFLPLTALLFGAGAVLLRRRRSA